MSRICPDTHEPVLYLTCLECDDRICERTSSDFNCQKGNDKDNDSKESKWMSRS